MSAELIAQGAGGIASARYNLASDARILRRLLRIPLYIPNEVFKQSARKMLDIVNDDTLDPRARVGAQKVINDMMKLNLEAVQVATGQASQKHLHLHQHVEGTLDESLTLNEIARITSALGTPEVIEEGIEETAVETTEPAAVESVEK